MNQQLEAMKVRDRQSGRIWCSLCRLYGSHYSSECPAHKPQPAPTPQAEKIRYPNADGMRVAAELCAALKPVCVRLIVAGSLRRRKPTVGDVEILYIGQTAVRPNPADMFSTITVNCADVAILQLEVSGVLERRKNARGSQMYGPKNKLMRHLATGIPVDLFAATEDNWWNYLVCRTGPAESNTRICMAAQDRGWKWNPYGPGFTRGSETVRMESEAAVFDFVNLPYAEPADRK
jgi:DNA polymerase/3'-5' exonuclease PolX